MRGGKLPPTLGDFTYFRYFLVQKIVILCTNSRWYPPATTRNKPVGVHDATIDDVKVVLRFMHQGMGSDLALTSPQYPAGCRGWSTNRSFPSPPTSF